MLSNVNLTTIKTYGQSFILGLCLLFAYAPFSQWWITLVIFPLWFYKLKSIAGKSAFNHGFYFGLGWFLAGLSWVYVCIDRFGGTPIVVSLLLMLMLAAYLALFPALACYLSVKFNTKQQLNLFLLPITWLLCEWLRANLLTGFPWLSIGYSQIDGPLAALAPIIGEIGITFVIVLLSILVVTLLQPLQRIKPAAGITLIFALVLWSNTQQWGILTGKSISTALVQGNVEQELKWEQDQQWPSMMKYLTLTKENYDADLIIWPESAITGIEPLVSTQEFLDIANRSATLNKSTIITGIINYNFESRESYNSLVVLGLKHKEDMEGSYYYNNSNRYYKNHLLPIGEFVPFGDLLRPLAPLFNLAQSSFSRGDYIQSNIVAQGLHLLPLICFEIAFPEQLAANFTNQTDMILTVSNDAWFGDSHGPHQHLEIARMRALEFARPVLRSTNNGVTAIIDHNGNIQQQLPQFQQLVLKGKVDLVRGSTPYQSIAPYITWLLIAAYLSVYIIFHLLIIKRQDNK
ncbi:apolipoprotein N-acyltransferase [Thalassotalea piscium]|uniref:Apolipoprotein N-acyltransferase n=1 Tax=Thalassotalea piscium TaxID=1230533 RepID=A0A7X0NIS1_9GAMM|nr:apolipoprotein N-acyltransferase [Thalassotalea piscium]MBB6544151.1 apolipoprotein N-acyltransferase [Thalassotalea piscium]